MPLPGITWELRLNSTGQSRIEPGLTRRQAMFAKELRYFFDSLRCCLLVKFQKFHSHLVISLDEFEQPKVEVQFRKSWSDLQCAFIMQAGKDQVAIVEIDIGKVVMCQNVQGIFDDCP